MVHCIPKKIFTRSINSPFSFFLPTPVIPSPIRHDATCDPSSKNMVQLQIIRQIIRESWDGDSCKQNNISAKRRMLNHKQPWLFKSIILILQFKPWEAGLDRGRFAEKGPRQRILFMPDVKEHIRIYITFKHWFRSVWLIF